MIKGLWKGIIKNFIYTFILALMGWAGVFWVGENYTQSSYTMLADRASQTIEIIMSGYLFIILIMAVLLCIKLGTTGIYEDFFNKKSMKDKVFVALRIITIIFIIIQIGMTYVDGKKFEATTLKKYEKIADEMTASLEIHLGMSDSGLYSNIVYSAEDEYEEDIEVLKEAYGISDNIKEAAYTTMYDEESLNMKVRIEYDKLDEKTLEDAYKLSRFIKLDEKSVITKEMFKEFYEKLDSEDEIIEVAGIEGDGYLKTSIECFKDDNFLNISLDNYYLEVNFDE